MSTKNERALDFFNNLNFKGQFSGHYKIGIKEFKGDDFSKKAFLFSGQGTEFPKMLPEYFNNDPLFVDLTKSANQYLSKIKIPFSIVDYWSGKNISNEYLGILKNFSLLISHVGLFYKTIATGQFPEFLAGYSFGELSALVVTGSMSFDEMLDYVYWREQFCSEIKYSGVMIAISSDLESLKIATKEIDCKWYLSNISSKKQLTIAVEKESIENFKSNLKKYKIPHKELTGVLYPYHTPWMKNVAVRLENYLSEKQIKFKAPKIPIYSFVIKKCISEKDNYQEMIREVLINQSLNQVDFIDQIEKLFNDYRVRTFLEISPTPTLVTFARSVLGQGKGQIYQAVDKLRETLNKTDSKKITIVNKDSKYIKKVLEVISRTTGYEIEEISIEDRYQDDLGIDSVKKAEIFFSILQDEGITPQEVMGKSNVNLGAIKTVIETAYFIENFQSNDTNAESLDLENVGYFERIKISHDKDIPFANYQAPFLEKINLVEINDILKNDTNKIIVQDSLTILNVSDQVNLNNEELLIIAQKIKNELTSIIDNKLLVLFSSKEYSSGLCAFFKSLKMEYPALDLKILRGVTSQKFLDSQWKDRILMTLFSYPLENDFVFTGQSLKVASWSEAETSNEKVYPVNVAFIGGAKGIGRLLSDKMIHELNMKVVWIGRSDLNSIKNELKESFSQLGEKLAAGQLIYIQSDVNSPSFESELLQVVTKNQIELIINGAGVERSSLLVNKNISEIKNELNTKILSTKSILSICKSIPNLKALFFSTTVTHFGNGGQSIYTMANQKMAELVRNENNPNLKVVYWPAWDNVGMTGHLGILNQLKQVGVKLLAIDEAWKLFKEDLNINGRERDVFYLNRKDKIRNEYLGFNINYLSSIVGKFTKPNTFEFTKTISLLNTPYLIDHTLGETTLYPGSVFISLATVFGDLLKYEGVVFRKFKAHNMMVVNNQAQDFKVNLISLSNEHNAWNLSISSTIKHFDVEIYDKIETIFNNKIKNIFEREVDLTSFYSKDCINLGPKYRVCHKAYLDSNENLTVHGQFDENYSYDGDATIDFRKYIIEIAFQSLGMSGLTQGSGLTVPGMADYIWINLKENKFNYTPEKIIAMPFIKEVNSDFCIGDVCVVNEQEEVLLVMNNVQMSSIQKYQNKPLRVNKL